MLTFLEVGKKQLRPLLLLFFIPIAAAASNKAPSEIYPNRLITPDFGIVTADDLAYDDLQRYSMPYDPTKRLSARYWQCVPKKAVHPKYNAWRGEDGMGPAGAEILMCNLEIEVNAPLGLQIYGDRRRHPNSFCREFERNWRQLTRGEKRVCFSGDDPSNVNDEALGKYRAWVWNKFKTRKGCYSYFGDCDVSGCANGKCPK